MHHRRTVCFTCRDAERVCANVDEGTYTRDSIVSRRVAQFYQRSRSLTHWAPSTLMATIVLVCDEAQLKDLCAATEVLVDSVVKDEILAGPIHRHLARVMAIAGKAKRSQKPGNKSSADDTEDDDTMTSVGEADVVARLTRRVGKHRDLAFKHSVNSPRIHRYLNRSRRAAYDNTANFRRAQGSGAPTERNSRVDKKRDTRTENVGQAAQYGSTSTKHSG